MQQQSVLHVAMTKAVRIAKGVKNYKMGKWCSEAVLYQAGSGYLDVSHLIRQRRLQYVLRILTKAPVVLKAFVQYESHRSGSWAALIRADLQWLWPRDKSS